MQAEARLWDPEPICTPCREKREPVDRWNRHHPIGAAVRYWTGERDGDGKTSVTRTVAELLGGHTPVVWVEGEASCIALTHVEPDYSRKG